MPLLRSLLGNVCLVTQNLNVHYPNLFSRTNEMQVSRIFNNFTQPWCLVKKKVYQCVPCKIKWKACVHCGKADDYMLFCNSSIPKLGKRVDSRIASIIYDVPAVTLSSCILTLDNLVPDSGDFIFERHAQTAWLPSPP